MPVLMAAAEGYTANARGLLFACWAIVIVLSSMFLVFMRARKREYAYAIIPLVLLPLVHIFSGLLARLLAAVLPFGPSDLRRAIDVTGGLVACLLIGWTARRIQGKRTRMMFAVCCTCFLVILTLVLVVGIA